MTEASMAVDSAAVASIEIVVELSAETTAVVVAGLVGAALAEVVD
jgi:hypothetical protein